MAKEEAASPVLLPTVETKPEHATGSEYVGSPAVRRHGRKRSSTIIIPSPQQATTPTSVISEAGENQPVSGSIFRGAKSLAVAQVVAKLLSFFVNQLLLRFVDARDLGYAAQLDFFGATVLALSRDAIRIASQRQHTRSDRLNADSYRPDNRPAFGSVSGTFQEAVNMGWASFGIGMSLTTIILIGQRILAGSNNSQTTRAAIYVYGIASVVELCSEPAYLLLQLELRLDMRGKAEALGTFVRCLVALGLMIFTHSPPAVAFACAELAHALALTTFYGMWAFDKHRRSSFSLLPQKIAMAANSAWIDRRTARLARGLEFQEFTKYLLTEGDKVAVSLLTTLEQQGEYALASNYGSLVARMILFPVEEALRAFFSRTLHGQDTEPESSQSIKPLKSPVQPSPVPVVPVAESESLRRSLSRRIAPAPRQANRVSQASSSTIAALTTTLRVYSYAGLVAVGFGTAAAPYLLGLIAGSWTTRSAAGQVLSSYVWYIPILAWNGALEAFVQSVAGVGDLKHQGAALAVLAVAFVGLVYAFVDVAGMGSVGLVWAQFTAMLLRIAWAAWFVTKWTRSAKWLSDCTPKWQVLGWFCVVTAAVRFWIPTVSSVRDLMIFSVAGGSVAAVAVAVEPDVRRLLL